MNQEGSGSVSRSRRGRRDANSGHRGMVIRDLFNMESDDGPRLNWVHFRRLPSGRISVIHDDSSSSSSSDDDSDSGSSHSEGLQRRRHATTWRSTRIPATLIHPTVASDEDGGEEEEEKNEEEDGDDDEEEEEEDYSNEEEEEEEYEQSCYLTDEEEEMELEQYMEELEDLEEFNTNEYEYMRSYILGEGFGIFSLQLYVSQLRLGIINHEVFSNSMTVLSESDSYTSDNTNDTREATCMSSAEEYSFARNIVRYFAQMLDRNQHLSNTSHMYLCEKGRRNDHYHEGLNRLQPHVRSSSSEDSSIAAERFSQASTDPGDVSLIMKDISIFDFVNSLPQLEEWGERFSDYRQLNFRNTKDTLIKKIVLDLYDKFYTMYEEPPHLRLQEQLIPIALHFYSNLSDETIRCLKEKQKRELIYSIPNLSERRRVQSMLTPCDSRHKAIIYYTNKVRSLQNVNGRSTGEDRSKLFL